MSETTAPPAAPQDKGLVARFIGVITAPRETYAAWRRRRAGSAWP